MDRAERPPQPDRVDEERTQHHRQHQPGPDPADRPVRDRALGRSELERAQREGADRGEGVDLDDGGRRQQRSEAHLGCVIARCAHCDEAISINGAYPERDCFASLAMTIREDQAPEMNERSELASNSTSSSRLLTKSPMLTMPRSRPSATTGKWRMRRLVISAIKSPTLSPGSQVTTVRVMIVSTVRDRRS